MLEQTEKHESMPYSRGDYSTEFNTGRLRPKVQPFTLLYTIFAEKVPLLYTFF